MRRRSYERWEVRGYSRPVLDFSSDGEVFETGALDDVVVVFDAKGRQWHVTVEQEPGAKPRITSLMIQGGTVDQATLRQVSLGYLAEAAAGYLAAVEDERDKGAPLHQALDSAAFEPGEVRLRGDAPSPEQFAEQWQSTPVSVIVGGHRVSRREALAQHFNVSVWSIDKYAREARDAGLIHPATTGRKRRPAANQQTTGQRPAGRTTQKEKNGS